MVARLAVLVAVLLTHGTPVLPTPTWWTPTAGATWDIVLSEKVGASAVPMVDVIDLDIDLYSKADIDAFHARGMKVLCYFSAGTYENWRPDAHMFPAVVIGNAWDEWEGERFLDMRAIDALAPVMQGRMDTCKALGFDGIDPDCIDVWDGDTGFHLTEADATKYATWLAHEAHARGLAISQKNAPTIASDLVDVFDMAVTEDCVVDGWCGDMQPYLDADRPMLAIEYSDRIDARSFRTACRTHPELSLVYKHRDLGAWSLPCSV